MERAPDHIVHNRTCRHLSVVSGRIWFDDSTSREGRVGHFDPQGSLYFSPEDQVIIQGKLKGRIFRLGHLGNASIAALAPVELRDGRIEVGAGEVGPHPLAEDDLRIGDLPEQAIAQPPLAAAADEQVHVGSGLSDMVRVRQQA